MTKITTYCDHCGKELNDMEDYISCEIQIAFTEIEADLCNECRAELTEIAKGFCTYGERREDT